MAGPRARLTRAMEPLRRRIWARWECRAAIEERAEEGGEVGVVADDQHVFALGVVMQQALELLEGGGGGERVGLQNGRLVAGLGADEGGGLQAALERAGDDEVELDVQRIEDVSELQAVALALFVERSFDIEEGIGAAGSGTGVTEDEQIHNLLTIVDQIMTG